MNYSRELLARLRPGSRPTTAIEVPFGPDVLRDVTNVSVNDYFRLVVRLFGLVFLSSGVWFKFHALSPSSGGWEFCKPIVQREHSKTCPEGVGSFFFN